MNRETDIEKSERLQRTLVKAKELYTQKSEIWCPYFSAHVALTSDGFNHLLNKLDRTPRTIDEQLLKLNLLRKALTTIQKAGTLQEYRDTFEKAEKVSRDGFYKTSQVQYWGFEAIMGNPTMIKIRVIIKKTGDGKLVFWSVMPCGDLKYRKLDSVQMFEE